MASLRRLTIACAAALGVTIAATGYATFTSSRIAIRTLVDRRIEAAADSVLDEAGRGRAGPILARIDALSRRRDTADIGLVLLDPAGRRLGGNVTRVRPLPFGLSSLDAADGIPGLTSGRAAVVDAGGGLRLVALAETEPFDGYGFIRARNYSVGFGAILLVAAAAIAAFGLLVRRRIGEIRTTAEAIVEGDLTRRVAVEPGGGAFARQAESFNRMLDRIGRLVDDIRGVSSDVAHDLRAPLARLRSRLALLAASVPVGDIAAVEHAIADCDALLATFAAILRIAEVEGGERRAAFRPVALGALAGDVVETLAATAAESGHALSLSPGAEVTLPGDRNLLTQALLNLVENALLYTPPGSTVRVGIARTGAHVTIVVADDGPGVAPDDRPHALRRFGRLDGSRSRAGHGLGLPLVEAIARLHGGTLTLGDARPGLVATLTLPLPPEPA